MCPLNREKDIDMKTYNIRHKTDNKTTIAGDTKTHYLPALYILIATLIFIISFTGCSGSEDSSYVTSTISSVDTNAASGASLTTMQWGPRGFNESRSGTVYLYEDEIPNSIESDIEETSTGEGTSLFYYNVSVPTLTAFLPPPDTATGTAIIYCPGGGYVLEGYGQGIILAEEFNRQGIALFILKYRLPSDSIMVDKTIGPLQDAQQAIKIIRERSEEWGIDPTKIGIMGYSAGGHLAATSGVHFDKSYIPNEEDTNLRPDFMILVSSVISMYEDITHQGSRDSLLGENPEDDLVEWFSNETQISEDTPPAWLIHAEDDTTVSVENSILFYEGLVEKEILAELNLYDTGSHNLLWNLSTNEWMHDLLEWMDGIGMMTME